jgi:hypothetical protein
MFRKASLVISLALNLLFILLVVLALFQKTAAVTFYELPGSPEPLTAAVLVTVPRASGSVVFNAVEITLQNGSQAALQFSAAAGGRQSNLFFTALYDHAVISVTHTGYGVLITARAPGETVMQTLGDEGFRDLALVKVLEK